MTALFLGSLREQTRAKQQWDHDLVAFDHCSIDMTGNKTMAAMLERSCFSEVAVEQLSAMFKLDSDSVSHRFLAWNRKSWEVFLGSQVVEDCFQRCGRITSKATNLRAREKRVWAELIEGSVLEGSHSFEAIQATSKGMHQRNPQVDETTFEPKLRDSSIAAMRRIVGFEDKVKWYSLGVHALAQPFTDLEVMQLLKNNIMKPTDLDSTWLASLLRSKHCLLVRRVRDGVEEGDWCFCLNDVPDSCAIVWPASSIKIGNKVFWVPADGVLDVRRCLLPAWNLAELKVVSTSSETCSIC